jgi:hypothetical protein
MEMPKPTKAHRKLTCFDGNWTGAETIPPCPWDPQGGTATGRCQNRVAVDGFIVVHDYEQTRNGAVNFRGHGVFTYDPTANQYHLTWWDSMGVAPNIFKGDFKDNTLAMVCVDGQGHSRTTWEFRQPNEYFFHMEMSQDGQQWMTLMEGTYTRQGGTHLHPRHLQKETLRDFTLAG